MIRVLHFGLCSSLGGIETYLMKITQNIDRTKYQFDFLTLGNDEPCGYEELSNLGCKFYSVKSRRDNYFKYISELKMLFKKEHFDIVHCHLNSLKNISVVLLALKNGCTVIVHSRNGGGCFNIFDNMINTLNYYRLPRKKIKMISVSDVAGKWMFGKNEDFIVLNNGIETEKYKFSSSNRKILREKLAFGDSSVIIHTGAFRKQKNHEFLIDIFKKVIEKNSNYKLVLVGDGPLKGEIMKKAVDYGIDQNIIFMGIRKDIPALLSACDYYLFPSLFEGFPNSLIEAEANGLPCLVSNVITKEAMIPELCEECSLDDSSNVWAERLLSQNINTCRKNGTKLVQEKGLGINLEIERLCKIYNDILHI